MVVQARLKELFLAGLFSTFAVPVSACELALAFAVDISGSVDSTEYQIQMQGLATGLRDGIVSEALVRSNARLMLMQWTGTSRQVVSVPWTEITEFEDVEKFADLVETAPRGWRNFSTAIGDALHAMLPNFEAVNECERLVIDVSGDGSSNEGREPRFVRPALREAGITVNALVIEGVEDDLTGYFWENVITGEGAFVVTANGFREYAQKMRKKLVRETTKAVSLAPDAPTSHPVPATLRAANGATR